MMSKLGFLLLVHALGDIYLLNIQYMVLASYPP